MNPQELVGRSVEELNAFKTRAENYKIIKEAELDNLGAQVIIDKVNKNREIAIVTANITKIQDAIVEQELNRVERESLSK